MLFFRFKISSHSPKSIFDKSLSSWSSNFDIWIITFFVVKTLFSPWYVSLFKISLFICSFKSSYWSFLTYPFVQFKDIISSLVQSFFSVILSFILSEGLSLGFSSNLFVGFLFNSVSVSSSVSFSVGLSVGL